MTPLVSSNFYSPRPAPPSPFAFTSLAQPNTPLTPQPPATTKPSLQTTLPHLTNTPPFDVPSLRGSKEGTPLPRTGPKAPKPSSASLRKGPWSTEEDAILLDWVKLNGANKWTECSKKIRGRSGKQCRERWVNILNPSVKKGNWSEEEQDRIFDGLVKSLGSWSSLAKKLPGRTENSIKNYFYSSIRRIKSNPVFTLLKEVCSNRPHGSLEQGEGTFFHHEVSKLNRLSQKICKSLVELPAKDPFKQFLAPVVLSEEATPSEDCKPSIQTSSVDLGQSFQVVRDVEKIESPVDFLMLLTKPDELVRVSPEPSPAEGKKMVTLKIPYCWSCYNKSCSKHPEAK